MLYSRPPFLMALLPVKGGGCAACSKTPTSTASIFQSMTPHALLIDETTGTVLLEKNATQPMVPSSMTKILTVYMVFEALKAGTLKLTDKLPVIERARRIKGTKMFVKVGDWVSVEDLLRGIIVSSGNDASVVIAEAFWGTEEAFAQMLTQKAEELGATNNFFFNSTGLHVSGQSTTAHDLASCPAYSAGFFHKIRPLLWTKRIFL